MWFGRFRPIRRNLFFPFPVLLLYPLTTLPSVVILYNIKARPLIRQRMDIDDGVFAEYVVWEVPAPVDGCEHSFKYRLALVVDGKCVLRFDNETGKGDHYHIGNEEHDYQFKSVRKLLADFKQKTEAWRRQ